MQLNVHTNKLNVTKHYHIKLIFIMHGRFYPNNNVYNDFGLFLLHFTIKKICLFTFHYR